MLDIERDEGANKEIEFDGYVVELTRDRTGLWVFLKGHRTELPKKLSGRFTSLLQAQPIFEQYVTSLTSYSPGKKKRKK